MAKTYNTSAVTEKTPVEDMAEILAEGPPGPWPDGWASWENTQKAHVLLLDRLLETMPEYPDGRWLGRGIVISVNAKPGTSSGKYLSHGYFPGAWVVVNEIRRHGCTLPIVFAHVGKAEWDANLTKVVAPLGVTVMDLEESDPYWKPMRILAGWESKIDAVCRCPFEEVLYLDADSIPLRNPDHIFDAPHLKHYGAILFPDVPPHDRKEWLPKEVWDAVGLEHHPEVRAAETGQYFVHKKTWWKELNVCRWINEHSDRYYKVIFGDKDSTVLASQIVYDRDTSDVGRTLRYFMPDRSPGGNHASLIQHWVDGAFTQHLTRNKPDMNGFPHRKALMTPDYCYAHLKSLREVWHGRLWFNADPDADELAAVAELVEGEWVYERTGTGHDGLGSDSRAMSFLFRPGMTAYVKPGDKMPVYRVGDGIAGLEVGWSVMKDDAGVLLIVHDLAGAPTMFLRKQGRSWKGRWVVYEKCKVELRRPA